MRCDHPSDSRKGGVCVYYKNYLPLIERPDITCLNECSVCELRFGNKKCFITLLYRSPSQTPDEFSVFKRDLEETIININNNSPFISLLIGDFNARNSNWWANDINNACGLDIDTITSHNGLYQMIDKPTHILPGSASCIDLLFTNEPGLITNSGVHPSLFPRCHHQIIFAKFNFKIHFPPAYERLIWDFSKANVEGIKASLSSINWNTSLKGLNVNDQVEFLTNCIKNIFKNFAK